MKNLITLVLLFASVIAMAQTGTISGQIISEDGITLPGATIRLTDTPYGAISDVNGEYKMTNIPTGDYTLAVSYIGYGSESRTISLGTTGTTENFTLGAGIALNDVIVVGQNLQGISRALNQQKNNENITNVVSADQMGRFPDANIGDAMKRITGVTMQNDQGEARNIFIRGIAPQYNSVTLNGDRIPSAEGDNRNVQMDLIPADMVQLVEVNKALTPEMDGDAIGGSVNLVTRTATSEPRLSVTVAPGYSPIREKGNFTGGVVAGKRFANDKFGVIFTGAFNDKDYGSDNFEAEYSYDDSPADAYMSELQIRKYDVRRKRMSGGLDLDYKFNANHKIRFKTLLTDRKDWENRYRLTYKKIKPNGEIGEIRRETKGGINNDDVKNRRLEHQKMNKFGFDGEHTFGKLSMDWGLSYSDASEKRPNERYIVYRKKDLTGTVTGFNTENPFIRVNESLTPDDFKLKEITEEFQDTKEENVKGKLKFTLPIMEGVNSSKLKFGYTFKNKTKNRDNIFYEYEDDNDVYKYMSATTSATESFNNNNLNSQYAPGVFTTNEFLGDINLSQLTRKEVREEYIPGNYDAEENVNAGFLQYNQKIGERWSFIAGGRYEATSIDYTANNYSIDDDSFTTRNGTSDYNNFLPSIHANFRPNNDAVVRLAWTNSMARPNYFDVAPYRLESREDEEIAEGNPNLKAAKSMNLDLMGEYYLEEIGLVSLGTFYKNIDDFFFDYNGTTQFMGETFEYTQPRNGLNAKVYGFEASFQRQLDFLGDFFGKMNLYTNYTYTGSDADLNADRKGLSLAGTAPHLINASLAYEDNRFNGRLSFNHTSDYVDEYGDELFEDVFYDKSSFLDLNANYLLKNNWTIFAEAKNLTNQPLRYYQGYSQRTYQVEYYQPTYNLGVKFDF